MGILAELLEYDNMIVCTELVVTTDLAHCDLSQTLFLVSYTQGSVEQKSGITFSHFQPYEDTSNMSHDNANSQLNKVSLLQLNADRLYTVIEVSLLEQKIILIIIIWLLNN